MSLPEMRVTPWLYDSIRANFSNQGRPYIDRKEKAMEADNGDCRVPIWGAEAKEDPGSTPNT